MTAPTLFPNTLDDLLSERRDANALRQMALMAYHLPVALYFRQMRWVVRLESRIAQVAA